MKLPGMSLFGRSAVLLIGLLLAPVWRAGAQDVDALAAIASWTTVDVVTGYETRTAGDLAAAMPGWTADHWGNLVRVVGSGSPRRIVACALDRPGLSASQITDDGYLRVHRIGRGSDHPLWDQAFEAQQVRVLTRSGPVSGVVARSNGHFAAQHRGETDVVGADDLWVDVGATSAEDVAALGIGLLDPIVRHLPAWPMEGGLAGPEAGRMAGCAAAATLAEAAGRGVAPSGETHFLLSAQQGFGWVGLSSYIARGGPFDGVVVLAPGAPDAAVEDRAADSFGSMGAVLVDAGVESVRWIAPRVTSPGAHLESVTASEVNRILEDAAGGVGMPPPSPARWVEAPERAAFRVGHFDASVADAADLLTDLVEMHGVPGHEWAVRRYVLESLPDWARGAAVVDDIGNIWVEAGPERDTTVFMAHIDEVGYEVTSIGADGVLELRRLGGAVSSAWEGQTALLHFDPPGSPSTRTAEGRDTSERWKAQSLGAEAPAPLRGVFLTRDEAEQKGPPPERVYFGMNADELRGRGVEIGMQVTSHKEGLRMGRHRFVARALDDRAGTTALLRAVRTIDPGALAGKVIFAFSVHEEGGLRGAAAMARRFGRSTVRIYSIDTFVSSDTPLESPHFAYAPLGAGPVLRATENSGVSPDRERARVFAAAERAGIGIQMGLTQGGTDGTRFTFYGAPNQGLSWPGRYSHSPGEVLDLRDLVRLTDLIVAVANAGER